MQRPHLLPLALMLLCSVALAQDINPEPMTGGVQDFIEFTQIIPSMDKLLGNIFTIMRYMDLPGVADTIARIMGGVIALTTFGIAWFNYGFNKRLSLLGMDGSFNNMVWAALTVMLISTGVPRLVGEAGWAVWRVTYTGVEARVHPKMDEMIKGRTQALAKQVWAYGATGLSAGFAPIMAAGQYLKGDTDVSKDSVAGEAELTTTTAQVNSAETENKKFASIWQLGSLLIAGMFMAYIGVIFGSGLFVIFAATFMPVAFALLPINAGLMWKQIGGMVSSILVAGAAPGLMLVNVMVVFDGPIDYLTTMMKNQNIAAVDNAKYTAEMIKICTQKATEGSMAQKITAGVTDAINPLNEVLEKFCVVQTSGVQTLYTLGQATVFMIVGLAVAAMLFIGLSGLSMMIFREFKGRVDDIFGGGGTVGNGSNGAATKAISAMGNRLTGAAIGAAGVAFGNAQLASAGARSVVSGNNALAGAAASMIERGRDNKTNQQRTAQQGQQQAAAKAERQQDSAEREAAGDKKYEARQAASKAERQQEQTENRAYSEGLYTQRQEAAKAERQGSQERGEGSQTDPRSATSGGENAGKADGGAESYSSADGRSTTPSRGQQGGGQQGGGQQNRGGQGGTQQGGGTQNGGTPPTSSSSTQPTSSGSSATDSSGASSTVPQSGGTPQASGSTLPSGGAASGSAPTPPQRTTLAAGQGSPSAPRDDVQGGAGSPRSAGNTASPSAPRDDVSTAPVIGAGASSEPAPSSPQSSAAESTPSSAGEATDSRAASDDTVTAAGGNTALATPAPSVPAFDPNSRQAAADEAQASPATEATGTSAAGPQTPAITSPAASEPGAASAPGQATSSAPSAPTPSVPAAPSVALPAAYTSEGNSALKRSGVSAEDRNEAAVLDYHRMLNRPSEDAARGYISKAQAQWDLERRGMLPSQRDANAVKVQEYA